MIAESFEAVRVKNAHENAAGKIKSILAEEADPNKQELYFRAEKWVDDALNAVLMPDPSTRAIMTDWDAEFERKMQMLNDGVVEPLRKETEKDLLELVEKFAAFNTLYEEGKNLIEDIITEGLIKRDNGEDEEVDYKLLSVLEDVANVARYVKSDMWPMNRVLMNAGPTHRKLEAGPREEVDALGDKMDSLIDSLSLSAASSNGAATIAKNERNIKNKISFAEGEAYLHLAIDNMQMQDLSNYTESAIKQLKRNRDCKYAEVRITYVYGKGAYAIDGGTRGSGEGIDLQLGVEVVAAQGDEEARGDYGGEFSFANLSAEQIHDKIDGALKRAYKRAKDNAKEKAFTRKELMKSEDGRILAESMENVGKAQVPAARDNVHADYEKHPMAEDIQDVINYVERISKDVSEFDSSVSKNVVYAFSKQDRHLYINSKGANIDETNVITQGGYFVVAQQEGRMPEFLYETVGGEGGFEVLTKGRNGVKKTLRDFVIDGTRNTVQMSRAEFFPEELAQGTGILEVHERGGKLYTDGTIKPSGRTNGDNKHNIILDTTAVTLPMHEVLPGISHRAESDRVKGDSNNEAGYTDDGNFFSNNVGKQVASPIISALIDARYPGIGHRHYDDQGVKAEKHVLLDKGILMNLLNDLETANDLGLPPTGCSYGIKASVQPLVRMNCTFIAPGETSPDEMTRMMGTDGSHSGYIVRRIRTPAITAGRGNGYFDAMCVTPVIEGKIVYDERTGEPVVYRGAGVMADTPELWGTDVWAVGNDFESHSIFNCGKGRGNMQAKEVEHGAPSIGTRAYLTAGTDIGASIAGIEEDIASYVKSFGNKSRVLGVY